MVLFKFLNPVLPEGMTFVFGLWVCVANGADSFHQHVVDDAIKPETSAARLDNFINNLGELPFLILLGKPRQSLSLLFLSPRWRRTWTLCSRLGVPMPPHVGGLRIT
jgi:hypothetical protein